MVHESTTGRKTFFLDRSLIGTWLVFVAAFLYRFLTAALANDHFMHLAEAQQVLSGEWPVRDFFDFGLPFQVLTSAIVLAWSHHNLVGEVLVTVAFVSASAALTWLLAYRLTQSLLLSSLAAAITIMSEPRLYNYPKVFFYVLALWGAHRYVSTPGTPRAVALAVITALAFLFRHDHGVYIAAATLAFFSVYHWEAPRTALRPFASYVAAGLLAIAPFLLFVHTTVGLREYIRDLQPGAGMSLSPRFNRLPLTFNRKDRVILIAPPGDVRINVRWAPTTDADTRQTLEQRYHLADPQRVGGETWSYVPQATDRATLSGLLAEEDAVDTHGIDRSTGALDVDESWYEWFDRHVPIFRMDLAPSITSDENALAWFYYVTFFTPLIAAGLWLAAFWRGRVSREHASLTAMAIVAALIVTHTLVRGSPDSRLPDVTPVVAIVGAWACGRWLAPGTRRWRAAVALALFLITFWSVGTYSAAGQTLAGTRLLDGPVHAVRQGRRVVDRFRRRPAETLDSGSVSLWALARYANQCTKPTDRIMVTWFEPMIYLYADRRFAGGMVFFDNGWFDSAADQQIIIRRLADQRVPLAFVRTDQEKIFRTYFPVVARYVDETFRSVAPRAGAGRLDGYRVLIARDALSLRDYEPLGLPCFAPDPSAEGVTGLTTPPLHVSFAGG